MINNKIGYVRENNIEERGDIRIEIITKDTFDEIMKFEKEIWEINSDTDLIKEYITGHKLKVMKSYMICDNHYIYGYILLNKRFYKKTKNYDPNNPSLSNLNEVQVFGGCFDVTGIDIEDLVMINPHYKPFYTLLKDLELIIIDSIHEHNPDFMLANFNSYSKSFKQRLKSLNYPILNRIGYGYRPYGYENIRL